MFEELKEVHHGERAVSSRCLLRVRLGSWIWNRTCKIFQVSKRISFFSLSNGKPLHILSCEWHGQMCVVQRTLGLLHRAEIAVKAVGMLLSQPGERLVTQTRIVMIRVARVDSYLLAELVMIIIHWDKKHYHTHGACWWWELGGRLLEGTGADHVVIQEPLQYSRGNLGVGEWSGLEVYICELPL